MIEVRNKSDKRDEKNVEYQVFISLSFKHLIASTRHKLTCFCFISLSALLQQHQHKKKKKCNFRVSKIVLLTGWLILMWSFKRRLHKLHCIFIYHLQHTLHDNSSLFHYLIWASCICMYTAIIYSRCNLLSYIMESDGDWIRKLLKSNIFLCR